jgi:spore germination protein KA
MKFPKKVTASGNKTAEAASDNCIAENIHDNIARLKSDFGNSSDLEVSYFKFESEKDLTCANIYLTSLTDKNAINTVLLELAKLGYGCCDAKSGVNLQALISFFSKLTDSKEGSDYQALCDGLLSGNAVFLIDGYHKFFTLAADADKGRSIEEPTSQTIIRGPKEGFTEKINSNILLIRKRIKSKDLRVEDLSVGSVTKTKVSLIYIHKIAKEEIITE